MIGLEIYLAFAFLSLAVFIKPAKNTGGSKIIAYSIAVYVSILWPLTLLVLGIMWMIEHEKQSLK